MRSIARRTIRGTWRPCWKPSSLRPILRSAQGDEGYARFLRIVGHTWSAPGEQLPAVRAVFQEIHDRFFPALLAALPQLEPPDLYWRMHMIIGGMCAFLSDPGRIHMLSDGACDVSDAPHVVRQFVQFASGAPARCAGPHPGSAIHSFRVNRRSTIRILLVCAALESVAACKVLPHPDRPAPGVAAPEEWAAAGGRAPEAVSSAPWWRGFEDEALGAAIDEALVANRDLAASAARIVQALAQARIAGAERLPTLGLGADASRSGQILLGFPTPDGEPLSFVTNSFGVSLDLAWEVDLWGRIAAQSAAAEADFAATFETHEAARQSLAAQVAKAWFAWQEARLQGDLARRSEQTFTRTLELTRSRFESGLTSALDVRLAASNLAGAQALREQRGDAAQRAGRQLETLLGRYPSGDLAASTGLPAMPGRAGRGCSRRPARAATRPACRRGPAACRGRAALRGARRTLPAAQSARLGWNRQ